MKLGDVLKKERERKGVAIEAAAEQLGIGVDRYVAIEGGEDADFETAASLVLQFNEMVGGQVGQLYYPCGIPFTEVRDYEAR